jgi:hypothetical protein
LNNPVFITINIGFRGIVAQARHAYSEVRTALRYETAIRGDWGFFHIDETRLATVF